MEKEKVLKMCIERGFLIENSILNFLTLVSNEEVLITVLDRLKEKVNGKFITRSILEQNTEILKTLLPYLLETQSENLESLKIKLGLQIEFYKKSFEGKTLEELDKKIKSEEVALKTLEKSDRNVMILSSFKQPNNKIEVMSFVKNLRSRWGIIKTILQERQEMENLVSIDKLSKQNQISSIIGLILDKRVTRNKNIIFEVEDLSGKTNVLINTSNPEISSLVDDIALDSVIGFCGRFEKNFFIANKIIFPDIFLPQKKNSPFDESVAFLGDIHYGSKLFLEENFLKFIDYLNGKTPDANEALKIKYLFLVGDLVTGIGNYPTQEKDLKVFSLEEQFLGLSKLLDKIRKDIKIIISPGNHDGVGLFEPQPPLDEKYAWPLYKLENVFITGNPCYVKIGCGESFSGFDVLTYHGFSYNYYADANQNLMKIRAINSPENIMKYLLRLRHLAPTHSSIQRFPFEEDPLIIKKVPDIFVSGHLHKSGISYYNNILIISTSCWESLTEYQERCGNEPDYCKVPVFNLKTREIKVLDFE